MFRRLIVIAAVCVLWALPADAATVYTASGETYTGKVTRTEQEVTVETSKGRVVLKAKSVLHIEYTEPVKPDPGSVADPTTTPPDSTTQPVGVIPSRLLDSGAMVLGNQTRPEPIIYLYMRGMSAAAPGRESARVRRQIDLWRAHAHDRLRKCGKRWLGPKDFIRHRKAFVKLLGEADKLTKLAAGRTTRRYSSSKTPPPLTAKQKRLKRQAVEHMLKAGRSWADPPMQSFLIGMAHLHARKYRDAEAAFKLGLKSAPLLAGLHQGLGLAYVKQEKHLSALESFVEALRLKPDSGEALHLVRETMKLAPGRSIKSVAYRRAVKAVEPYTTPPRTSGSSSSSYRRARNVDWLMPSGKPRSWQAPETTMPTPPYDRVEFRQGVGVPLGKHVLVVDSSVVEGAMEVFVRIDGVFVPASVGRSSYSRTRGKAPIAMVYLTERVLTPVNVPTKDQPPKAGDCTAHALGIFGQMTQKIRKARGVFEPGGEKETGSVSCKLAPGEATSPVLSSDGGLVGFLAGKTTVTLDRGGPDKFISLKEVSSIIRRAASTRTRVSRSSYGAAQRKVSPKPAEGKTFVVYAILGEVFKPGV